MPSFWSIELFTGRSHNNVPFIVAFDSRPQLENSLNALPMFWHQSQNDKTCGLRRVCLRLTGIEQRSVYELRMHGNSETV